MDWEERLTGLGLIVLGLAGLLLVTWISRGGAQLAPPPGMPSGALLINPLGCLVPFLALGSLGVILMGVKKLVLP